MAGYSMPSQEVYHQRRVAHSIGLPNDDATLDQLVVHYEGMNLIDFPPRLNGSIITNDRRAAAFTRWYNDPEGYRVNIPAYHTQPQYYYFSPRRMTEALANPRRSLRTSLQAFTQKIKAESAQRQLRPPTVTSIGWNPTTGDAAFGSTNEPFEPPELRAQQRLARNPWRDAPWFQALLQAYQEKASRGRWEAGHPPGNCAEWNIPNALSMPETDVHLLTINTQTGLPKAMCQYCQAMVKEVCRQKNITVYAHTGSERESESVEVFRWLPNGVWSGPSGGPGQV
ncbi:hypothetical protein FA95DRAFT_1573342 [Auriscalpium vulgare]|uniref:Uncharacterized protein n=1 Tax=Auriscalpium vulgare TaxID=40419 RepID=A0ACB8RQ36_9AGAM|nr:hypothetical protein FA95DRAFT_1573342 [Auriscalpium vulgare]